MSTDQKIQLFLATLGIAGTLLGVAAGFGLQEWSERKKTRRNLLRLKEELRANFHVLNLRRPILEQMIAELKKGGVLPGAAVRCVDTFYRNQFASVCGHLTELECNSTHVIYERMRILDEFMESYEPQVKEIIRGGGIGVAQAAQLLFLPKLQDLLEQLPVTQDLIKKQLAGAPEDVLQVKTGES